MIREPYLLVVMIPCHLGNDGRRYVDPLWHKDLRKHLDQIADLTLAAPARRGPVEPTFLAVDDLGACPGSIRYADLPPCDSTASQLLSLPKALGTLWTEVGRAGVVHVGVAGWPLPYGWFAAPVAKLRGKFLVTLIESAPWRLGFGPPRTAKRWLQAAVFEAMAKICVNLADLAVFTHGGYLDGLLAKGRRGRGHVLSASWVDAADLLSPARAEALRAAKLADPARPLRAVFAASLQPSKGFDVLLEALRRLDARGDVAVDVEVFGKGPLLGECEALAAELKNKVRVKTGGMLAYGPAFFEMLGGHDVLVAPTVSDEQPRVVFDAFSQALPVIASDTPGMTEWVADGRNGRVVARGDAAALADALAWAAGHRAELARLGAAALADASTLTHDLMHARRAALIGSTLAGRPPDPADAAPAGARVGAPTPEVPCD